MKENKAIEQEIWNTSILYPKTSKEFYHHVKVYWTDKVLHKKAVLKNFGISFSIKMQAFRAPVLLKRDSNTSVFYEHWEIFKNTYFEVHLRTAASESFTWTFSYMNK